MYTYITSHMSLIRKPVYLFYRQKVQEVENFEGSLWYWINLPQIYSAVARQEGCTFSLTFLFQCVHFVSCDAEMPSVALLLLFCLGSCCFESCKSGRVLSYRQPSQGLPVESLWLHAKIPVLACVVPSLKERGCCLPWPIFFLSFLSSFSPRKWYHAHFNSEFPDNSQSSNWFKVGFHKTAGLCSDPEGSQFYSLNQ